MSATGREPDVPASTVVPASEAYELLERLAAQGRPTTCAHGHEWTIATARVRVRGRMDPLNVAPTVKALVDGLTDAGVWVDDDHTHLVGPDIRAGDPDPTQPIGWHRLSIRIEEDS